MGSIVAFFVGLFVGGVIGVFCAALCAASGRHEHDEMAYADPVPADDYMDDMP